MKPANILVVVHDLRVEKCLLADFGEAKEMQRTLTNAIGTKAGTPVYMAPEMREDDDRKTCKADVFSAGVVLVEMSSGARPRPSAEQRKVGRPPGLQSKTEISELRPLCFA